MECKITKDGLKRWYQNQFQQLGNQEVISKDLASLISWRLTEKYSL